jgi:CRP-like cAMP-binding protein
MDIEVQGDHPLLRKLARYVRMSLAERRAIAYLVRRTTSVGADTDLVRQGEPLAKAVILRDGWAIRYRTLSDGRRQIMNFLLPGDMFDLCAFLLTASDHSVGTITPCAVHYVPVSAIADLFRHWPRLGAAMWKSALQEEATLRERILSLGRRSARERTAHLLYELWVRLGVVGLRNGGNFDLPLTQVELADALGLTPVHVSRTLHHLRQQGLIDVGRRHVTILRPREQAAYGEFARDHLHQTPIHEPVAPPVARVEN